MLLIFDMVLPININTKAIHGEIDLFPIVPTVYVAVISARDVPPHPFPLLTIGLALILLLLALLVDSNQVNSGSHPRLTQK